MRDEEGLNYKRHMQQKQTESWRMSERRERKKKGGGNMRISENTVRVWQTLQVRIFWRGGKKTLHGKTNFEKRALEDLEHRRGMRARCEAYLIRLSNA